MATTINYAGSNTIKKLVELCHTLALKPKFVTELPETGDERYIYFVYNSSSTNEKNIFDEYVWVVPTDGDPRWELLGSVALEISLDDYAKKSDFDGLKEYVEGLADSITNIEDGEVTAVEFNTTDAPELSITTSKVGTTVTATVTTDLSDYAKTEDLPEFVEITADEVQTMWDEANV